MALKVFYPFRSSENGGAQKSLLRLLDLFADEVEALILAPEGPFLEEAREQGRAVRVWPRDFNHPLSLFEFARLLKKERADLVHLHASRLLAFPGRFFSIPVIDRVNMSLRRDTAARGKAFDAFLYRQMDALIAVSHDIRRQLLRIGIAKERVQVIHNGVAHENFTEKRAYELGNPPRLGTLARLHPQKGLDILLDALAFLPDVHCHIAGEGPERRRLEQSISEKGLARRVHLEGQLKDPRPFLEGLDLYVQSSRYEPFSNASLEALASGLPVAASDVDGTREMIRHEENGLLFPPENPRALADCLEKYLENPELRRRCGQRARRHVAEHFSQSLWARKTLELYKNCIGPVGRGGTP
jgi:glycosyltransferase involved in cell wall biosynthesis